jgi:hypothetical protein
MDNLLSPRPDNQFIKQELQEVITTLKINKNELSNNLQKDLKIVDMKEMYVSLKIKELQKEKINLSEQKNLLMNLNSYLG